DPPLVKGLDQAPLSLDVALGHLASKTLGRTYIERLESVPITIDNSKGTTGLVNQGSRVVPLVGGGAY
ncbi:MAG: hypothetical protein ACYDB4_18965, partial [Candidatus Dormibacteraceae bacterium]